MSRRRRSYTREFKLSLIAQLEASDKTLVQVARENGIHPSLLTRWKRDYSEDPEHAFSGNGNAYKDKARIAELERLVGQLHAENDFLKKSLEKILARRQEERARNHRGGSSP